MADSRATVSRRSNDGGRLVEETHYYAGRKHGPSHAWWDNGKLKFEGTYHGGLLHGRAREWNADRTPLADCLYDLGDPMEVSFQNRTASRYAEFVLQVTYMAQGDQIADQVFRSRVDGSFFVGRQNS